MRTINIWRKQLTPELFENIALEPAIGKTNATVWRKNKTTGIVTGFHRGKQMQQYRAILVDKEKETKNDDI
jgi:hypothetical protein